MLLALSIGTAEDRGLTDKLDPEISSTSLIHSWWLATSFALRPKSLTPRRVNSSCRLARPPSSVVQTAMVDRKTKVVYDEVSFVGLLRHGQVYEKEGEETYG